jgi:hypothetical protein
MHDQPKKRRGLRGRITSAHLIAALALFIALGGVAYASNPLVGPHGNINSCVPKNGGEVNIRKVGYKCASTRVGLAWAASGVTGPTGATGGTGATGPTSTSASTVDGETVTKLQLEEPTPTTTSSSVTLFSSDGLTIVADCSAPTGGASLQATGPASADSELTVSGYANSGGNYFGSETPTLGATPVTLGPASAGETSFSYENSSGQIVTGNIGYQNAPSLGSYAGCAFFGTVITG